MLLRCDFCDGMEDISVCTVECKKNGRCTYAFLSNQGCAIDCTESWTLHKVSLGRARDIMIRMFTAFLEYQTIILHYHDYGNRSADKIVFLKKVSACSIQRNAIMTCLASRIEIFLVAIPRLVDEILLQVNNSQGIRQECPLENVLKFWSFGNCLVL